MLNIADFLLHINKKKKKDRRVDQWETEKDIIPEKGL